MGDRQLIRALAELGERDLAITGVHVHRAGHQSVQQRSAIDVRREVYSVSKTITSIAVGLARAEGRLELDDPLSTHLGGLVAGAPPGTQRITVRHLLTMTSGIGYRWDHPDADHPGDPARAALTAPPIAEPGAAFAYRGANSYLLSRLVQAATGQDLRDYLLPRLFEPLGIANPQWMRCPLGFSLGAVGLHLRTEELARVGRMLLDDGRHGDRQVVPAGYVAAMWKDMVPTGEHRATGATASHPDNRQYGLQVWGCQRSGAWRMDGIHGQLCVILPEERACITVTADHAGPTSDVLDAVWDVVLPAVI